MNGRSQVLVVVAIMACGAVMVVAIAWAGAAADRAKAEACTHARDVAACLRDIK